MKKLLEEYVLKIENNELDYSDAKHEFAYAALMAKMSLYDKACEYFEFHYDRYQSYECVGFNIGEYVDAYL